MINVVWGAGQKCSETVVCCEQLGFKIEFIIDNDPKKQGQILLGKTIYGKDILRSGNIYRFFISSEFFQYEIKKEILDLGFECEIFLKTQIMQNASFAEYGEDIIVQNILKKINIEDVYYVEIGIPHGVIGSNTWSFHNRGMNGICIEANPDCIPELKDCRFRDVVLNLGVVGNSSSTQKLDFYRIANRPELNTFNKELADARKDAGFEIESVCKVECMDLNSILCKFSSRCPDYISMDIEGLEAIVLQDFDFDKWPVTIWCIEKSCNVRNIMESKGYILSAETPSNWIYSINKTNNIL